MFGWIFGKRNSSRQKSEPARSYGIPTVKLNQAWWTDTVKADLRKNIAALENIPPGSVDAINEAALSAFRYGFDLQSLSQAFQAHGINRKRAREIALNLSSKTDSLMWAEHYERTGTKEAIWLYSGAPCKHDDDLHKAANRKRYDASKGLFLNGKWTLPGYEDGCKCVGKPVVKGFS